MKNFSIIFSVLLLTKIATANTVIYEIKSRESHVQPAKVQQVINLVNKFDRKEIETVNVVASNSSLDFTSEGLTPILNIDFGFSSITFTGSLTANFPIANFAVKLISARRVTNGVYRIVYINQDLSEVTVDINAVQMFKDAKTARDTCGDDHECLLKFNSNIKLETTTVGGNPQVG